MGDLFLYSTIPYLKYIIGEEYLGQKHFVWCSEDFEPSSAPNRSFRSHLPPTSCPRDIWMNLSHAVKRKDQHDYKIKEQKATLSKLALEWEQAGKINSEAKEDILFLLRKQDFSLWKPLILIIDRDKVKTRLTQVEMSKRAGLAPEYIIADLSQDEFEIIEP